MSWSPFSKLNEVQASESCFVEVSGVLPVMGRDASASLGGEFATKGKTSDKVFALAAAVPLLPPWRKTVNDTHTNRTNIISKND